MPSKNILDFQDSEVSSAELQDNQFIVRFSAAHVHHVSSQDDGPGFLPSIELTIDQPTIIQKDSGCVGRLLQGTLSVAAIIVKQVPIPYKAEADVELELAFANGSTCKVIGRGVTLKATGEERVVEWLKC